MHAEVDVPARQKANNVDIGFAYRSSDYRSDDCNIDEAIAVDPVETRTISDMNVDIDVNMQLISL